MEDGDWASRNTSVNEADLCQIQKGSLFAACRKAYTRLAEGIGKDDDRVQELVKKAFNVCNL